MQIFSAEKILKCHVKGCFKINGKQMIKMQKTVNMLDLIVWKLNKITIYELCSFKSILVPEDNRRQNPDEPYIDIKNILLVVMVMK